jgi:hypothetical protein
MIVVVVVIMGMLVMAIFMMLMFMMVMLVMVMMIMIMSVMGRPARLVASLFDEGQGGGPDSTGQGQRDGDYFG